MRLQEGCNEASQMLHNLAKRMARRDGTASQSAILSRLRGRITTEVMRRAARMVLRCLPRADYLEAQSGEGSAPLDAIDLRAGHPCSADLPQFS